MLYGFTGAHRSGKTTLAKKIAEDLNITFHATSTTEVAKRYGFDPVAPMTLRQRVELQTILLEEHIKEIRKMGRPLIVDRTPLDIAAYMMAEITMQSHLLLDPQTLNKVQSFVELAVDATKTHYDFLIYLHPLTHYEIDPTKPAPNRAYQTHHALLVRGLLAQIDGSVNTAFVNMESFDKRYEAVSQVIVARLDVLGRMRKSALHIH